MSIDRALAEAHDVLSESSCLVTEDVLHLFQWGRYQDTTDILDLHPDTPQALG
jgi:hypothetical protein